ncbi:MAG: hypothetical protein IJ060_02345 [Oscillospiraceae bacterium]|nr:hypothetical protein [Oscillospiraceae bacterium]
MGMFDKTEAQSLLYNYPVAALFQAMCAAVQQTSGFTVQLANPQTGTIQISKSMSMFTWGENLYVQIIPVSETQSNLQITCQSKLGTEIAARSKNRKNIQVLLEKMQLILNQMYGMPQQPYYGG